VLTKGTLKGSNGNICLGGQSNPNSTSEEFETLTKVQKKDKKNIISEIIKKSIPNLRPTLTEKQ